MTRPHPADFADAHRRHWQDAKLLFDRGRWANADYLYGLSAECGLKAIMRDLDMEVDAKGHPKEQRFRKHMPHLWPLFVDFMETAGELWDEFPDGEPFKDWWIENRYANESHFGSANVAPHRDAAEWIHHMVKWHLQGFES